MGVMLIPVVSSLSDDIITAVPRAMRDGSLGLGATRSETIKRVILPAALPGIVGAILLTASRAIGETMIVVLAAGVAANLTINPFEAMTTITVKIVNQLTGDLEFNSPQTLVAFALGLTLFVADAGDEHRRALHRAQVPGAVRMTDIAIDTLAGRRRRAAPRHRPEGDATPPNAASASTAVVAISVGLVFLAIMLIIDRLARATPPSGRRRCRCRSPSTRR